VRSDRGRLRTYKYGRRAEDSKRRKGDRYSDRPPVSGGGESLSPKVSPRGFQELMFWSSWSSFAPIISRLARARLTRKGNSRGSTPYKTATKPAENSRSNTITLPNIINILKKVLYFSFIYLIDFIK
jgi:hypothetical protein